MIKKIKQTKLKNKIKYKALPLKQIGLIQKYKNQVYAAQRADKQGIFTVKNTFRNIFLTLSFRKYKFHKLITLSKGKFDKKNFKYNKFYMKKMLKRIFYNMKKKDILRISIRFINNIKLQFLLYRWIRHAFFNRVIKIYFFPKYSHGGCRPCKKPRK